MTGHFYCGSTGRTNRKRGAAYDYCGGLSKTTFLLGIQIPPSTMSDALASGGDGVRGSVKMAELVDWQGCPPAEAAGLAARALAQGRLVVLPTESGPEIA